MIKKVTKEHNISLIVDIMSMFVSISSSSSLRSSKIFSLFIFITIYTTNSFKHKQLKHINKNRINAQLNSFLSLTESPKEQLLSTIDGAVNKLLVSPESLSDLKEINRFYGLAQESYLYDSKYNKKYNIIKDKYIDLTIKSETDAPVWSIGFNELIGQLDMHGYMYKLIYAMILILIILIHRCSIHYIYYLISILISSLLERVIIMTDY